MVKHITYLLSVPITEQIRVAFAFLCVFSLHGAPEPEPEPEPECLASISDKLYLNSQRACRKLSGSIPRFGSQTMRDSVRADYRV
jgi:hypothetical protein